MSCDELSSGAAALWGQFFMCQQENMLVAHSIRKRVHNFYNEVLKINSVAQKPFCNKIFICIILVKESSEKLIFCSKGSKRLKSTKFPSFPG
jgi:hypothetical protein